MEEKLKKLCRVAPGVQAAALISIDGLVITAAQLKESWEESIAAISSSIFHTSGTGAQELEQNETKQVVSMNEGGYIIVTKVGSEAILTVLTDRTGKLGMVLLEIEYIAKELEKHLLVA